MKALRVFFAAVLLALAFILEFWLGSIGVFINFALAALIAFAFLFDVFELIFLILIVLLMMNWQPAPSVELALFVGLPLVAYFFHKFSTWEAWLGNLSGIGLAVIIFYLALGPRLIVSGAFLLDLFTCLVFGGAVFALLNRRENR